MESALADPAFRPGFAVLLDRRGVSHTPTTETIKRAAEFFTLRRKLLEGCRMAAVVEAGSVYGMGRMLEAVSEGGPVTFRVFTAYEEASHWLGVSA